MPTITPIDLPSSPVPEGCVIEANWSESEVRSPITFEEEVQDFGGTMLRLSFQLPPGRLNTRAKARLWISQLTSLRGGGVFRFGDPLGTQPLGNPVGTPVVDGAAVKGADSIATRGWTPDAEGVLLGADWIQIGERLYMVNDQAGDVSLDADGSGNVTIPVFPKIREAHADGATIKTANCTGVWRLVKPSSGWQEFSRPSKYGISVQAIEAINLTTAP